MSSDIKTCEQKLQMNICTVEAIFWICDAFLCVKVDGVSTLGENIADNGGIKISLEAYQDWLKSHDGEDKLLPGLNMTSTQQFFLGYAQVFNTS